MAGPKDMTTAARTVDYLAKKRGQWLAASLVEHLETSWADSKAGKSGLTRVHSWAARLVLKTAVSKAATKDNPKAVPLVVLKAALWAELSAGLLVALKDESLADWKDAHWVAKMVAPMAAQMVVQLAALRAD